MPFFHRVIFVNFSAQGLDILFAGFVIGYFFGVFTIDAVYSANLIAKLKRYAEENQVVVRYEALKAHIRSAHDKAKERSHFLFPFRSSRALREHLREAYEALEERRERAVRK